MMREIAALTRAAAVEVPVIYRPTLRSLEEVVVPSMRAAFYVNNAVRNTHFVERRELVHVWLNHGDSEKPACYNPVHAIYDLLFAAGQAGIDRYARHGVDIARSKFEIVGRPQVERITRARGPIDSLEDEWISGFGLAQDTSLLIHDGQYTDAEYPDHLGWGHSALSHSLAFARRTGAERTVLFHHDPMHSDDFLDRLGEEAREHWAAAGGDPAAIELGMERTEYELPARAATPAPAATA